MGRVLHGGPPSTSVDCVSMGVPHLRSIASHTADTVQAPRVPFESVENALESSLGHNTQLNVLGGICRFIPMWVPRVSVYRVAVDKVGFSLVLFQELHACLVIIPNKDQNTTDHTRTLWFQVLLRAGRATWFIVASYRGEEKTRRVGDVRLTQGIGERVVDRPR